MTPTVLPDTPTFGNLLKQLRKRAGLKQGELAALVGFSVAMISRLEQNERLPDLQQLVDSFVPALNLQDEPHLTNRLIELAALARGEQPPTRVIHQRQVAIVASEETTDSPCALPAPPTEVIGREQEIKLICTRLQNHNGRLLTLIGPPGIGKTRLALAVAARMQQIYKDGARFVPLAAIHKAERVATTLVTQLNITDSSKKADAHKLIEFLRHKEILLVLDNFEQIISAVPLLAELLSECANLRLLVTSRERLHLRAEQRYTVPPLSIHDAVALFLQRTQSLDPDFVFKPQQQPALEAICRELDCLPLAIELCASRIELFAPTQLLARLQEQRLDLLSDGAHDLPPHHRTLRNAIERSYDLLRPDEQALFCALSVFVGSFDSEAVQALGFDALTLQSLLQKSLVHPAPAIAEQRRFLLLETLRDYAREKQKVSRVQGSGLQVETAHKEREPQRFEQLHAQYYLDLAEQAAKHLVGKTDAEWLQRLDSELENLRAAFHYWLAHAPHQAIALAGALKEFWYTRGYFQEGRHWLTQALTPSSVQPCTPSALQATRARALLSLAQLAQNQGDVQQALGDIDESIALYRQMGDTWGTAEALRESGWVLYNLHQRQPTVERFEESLRLFRQLGDSAKIAALLTSLVHLQIGQELEPKQAITYLQESIAILRALGNRHSLLFALNQQAEIELLCGDAKTAEQVYNESLTLTEQLGLPREQITALSGLTMLKLQQGNAHGALGDAQQALHIAQSIGERDQMMINWSLVGQAQQMLGNFSAALSAYAQSLALSLTLENRHIAADTFFHCSKVAIQQEKFTLATQLLAATSHLYDTLQPYLRPFDYAAINACLDQTRTALTEADFVTAWSVGHTGSFEEAITTARQFCLGS